MTDYGVTPAGFVPKTLDVILADIVARLKASSAVGPAQDYSTTAPLGQIVGALASEIAEVWELGQGVYNSGDPEAVEGVPQDQLYSLTGSERIAARASTCVCTLNLDPGITVAEGSQISVDGRPDLTFTLDADVTNSGGSAADFPGSFTCTATGPITANAGTLTVIDTAVSGWNSVTNAADAVLGRDAANAIEYRQRWSDERAQRGSTTVSAIRAALLDTETTPAFATIETVLVLENKLDTADANGLPPHSVEAILDDGPIPSVDDDAIAQVIWDRGASAGINTHGNTSGTATDSEGVEHVVYFSRVTRRPVYVRLAVTRGAAYPTNGDALVSAAIVAAGNALKVEEDVIALYMRFQAFSVAGVVDVPTFHLAFTILPTEGDNLTVGYRERATFDTTQIGFYA
jgi:hypothetical protein